ncbi:hypothetical protein [Roseovarius sp.]|uniref:hypothetical protein n=1 Tax=Roseovarius sp. TaxID=1486281 RepID=UPI003514EC3A
MSRIALRFLLTGIGFLLFGMLWGIQMGMVGDHSQMPSHAHLNLVGGVLFLIFGLFYHCVPESALGFYCRAHYWLSLIGVVVMVAGTAYTIAGGHHGLAILGSFITLAAMVLFGVVVIRHRG